MKGRSLLCIGLVLLSHSLLTLGQSSATADDPTSTAPPTTPPAAPVCPSNVACSLLGAECIDCNYTDSCHYGTSMTVNCTSNGSSCQGDEPFTRVVTCAYCYQLDPSNYTCTNSSSCVVATTPRATYRSRCTVNPNVVCLGTRTFQMTRTCNWTSGHRWSTALVLSITLGGFGVDRFYLGDWRNGLGKLFSFGGLGVWTLVDIILVAIGHLSPDDGSLYVT